MDIQEWEEKLLPLQDDEGEVFYDGTTGKTFSDMLKKLKEITEANESIAYRYIWTRVDTDGELYLLNGVHTVNKLDYCITTIPWWNGREDAGNMIEVAYESVEEY